jgi:uncharacterized ion transporter superfamily protein YfcC
MPRHRLLGETNPQEDDRMTPPTSPPDPASTSRFPTAYTILFALVVVMAALTWIIPAGEYQRAPNAALGQDVPVPDTYSQVDAAPQGLLDVLMAPIAGFYDPTSYTANAIDVSLFVLIVGGFLGVVTATGAINTGVAQAMRKLEGREKWMIPIMMALFAAGGTTYGMAEETLAFYVLLIPIMIAAGYDALTGVAIIMLGAGVGVIGSTINPFSTAIASDAAGIPFTQGMTLRFVILGLSWIAAVTFVMRYAERVRKDPSLSLVANMKDANEAHFLQKHAPAENPHLTGMQIIILILFAATFVVMVWGVASQGWWMAEMSALFLGASIVIGTLGWLGEKVFTNAFVEGARDLLGVALVIGLARGIVIIMDQGRITDTFLHTFEGWITGMSQVAFIDKDHASGLLARDLGADAYLMLTDVEGVFENWGTPNQSLVTKTTPQDLQRMSFPAGSMGPKVQAACEFVTATGGFAAIGALGDAADLIAGTAGTRINADR